MIRHLAVLLNLFRLPVIDEVEQDYVNAANTEADAVARRQAVSRGLFRRDAFEM